MNASRNKNNNSKVHYPTLLSLPNVIAVACATKIPARIYCCVSCRCVHGSGCKFDACRSTLPASLQGDNRCLLVLPTGDDYRRVLASPSSIHYHGIPEEGGAAHVSSNADEQLVFPGDRSFFNHVLKRTWVHDRGRHGLLTGLVSPTSFSESVATISPASRVLRNNQIEYDWGFGFLYRFFLPLRLQRLQTGK
jgi:hypothetical protein